MIGFGKGHIIVAAQEDSYINWNKRKQLPIDV